MSSSIEDQIVAMKFDNRSFETGVTTSLGSIDKLKTALQFKDSSAGLDAVNRGVQNFNMNPMANALQSVSKRWLTMTTIAVTAISNITNKVVNAGLSLAKSFTLDPIKQGFKEYETTLNSVQTIMANTGANVKTVNKYLLDLNHYSDKTIYNFSEMAKNIGTFTAAGVDLKTSTASIKGIANLAALSGSNSQQASTAMYQLSQAIASGKVGLQDWNSVVNAGMGGKTFQTALARTAVSMGELEQSQIKMVGPMKKLQLRGESFRESISSKPGHNGWLTSDVLVKTLQQFTGDLSAADLAAQGFTKSQIKAIMATARTAQEAATKVKTFTQLIDVVKESIGSGWAKIFQDLFGNFKEASKLWTSVSNVITGAVSNVFGSVDKMLLGWRKLDGFTNLWAGVGNIFKIIGNLLYPIIQLFKALLPSTGKAGSGLAKMTKGFADVTGWLVKVTSVTRNLQPEFRALGTIMHFVWSMVGLVIDQFKKLAPVVAYVGDYFKRIGEQAQSFGLNILYGIIQGLDANALKTAIVDMANNIILWIKDTLGIHSPATTMVPIGENIIHGIVEGLQNGATFMIGALQQIFIGMGQALKYMVANISYSDVLDTVNSGLFLGLVLLFRRFVLTFSGLTDNLSKVFGSASGVLDQFKNNLKSMQNEIRAKALMNIAIAVAVLAGSAVLLASVDSKKLGVALAAIGGLMVTLVGSMRLLTGGGGKKMPDAKAMAKQTAQIVALSGALVAFSTAVLILSGAVAIMGQLDPKTMRQGLEGVAAVIGVIVAATAILGKTGGGATILATSTAMVVLAAALTAFVGVMKLYESLDMKTIADGGGKAALVIAAIGLAMRAFGKNGISGAIGLTVASVALRILAGALTEISKIAGKDLLKTVGALVVLLTAIAAAALVLSAAEGGALSMLVFAAALIVLAQSLEIISKISAGNIAKALIAIVLALTLIAAAAVLLTPAVPLIAALGTALLLLGGAVFLAGVGVLAFATAMGILAIVGPAAFQSIADGIDVMVEKLPMIGEAIGGFFVSILTGIVKAAGPLAKAIGKLLQILLEEVTKLIPKAQRLIQKLINAIIDIVVHSEAHAARAMIQFLLAMLTAIEKALPKFIKKGTNIIVSLIEGLSKSSVRIANATGKAILEFLNGLDKAINKYADPIGRVGRQIAFDLVDGLTGGLLSYGVEKVSSAAHELAKHIPGPIRKFLGINSPSKVTHEIGVHTAQGLANGITANAGVVEKSATDMANRGLEAMKMTFNKTRKATDGLIDLQPKVTPVLDLSQLSRDASQISAKMGSHSVKIDASRHQARDIAAEHAARHGSGGPDHGGDTYNFNQTINSPKPVNHVKAYRGTKSQIALLKEVKGK